jgi:putative endonuclease
MNGRLYPGVSADPEERFLEHLSGRGALFTRIQKPKRLLWKEEYPDRSTAMKVESHLKMLSHWEKLVWLYERGAVPDPGARPPSDKKPVRTKRVRNKTIFNRVIRAMAEKRVGQDSDTEN